MQGMGWMKEVWNECLGGFADEHNGFSLLRMGEL